MVVVVWEVRRRWYRALVILMVVAVGPLLTPAFVPLAEEFGVPLQRFTLGQVPFSTATTCH